MRVEDSLLSIKLELERVKEERDSIRMKVDSLSSDMAMQQKKNQQLNRDLHKAQQEVYKLISGPQGAQWSLR